MQFTEDTSLGDFIQALGFSLKKLSRKQFRGLRSCYARRMRELRTAMARKREKGFARFVRGAGLDPDRLNAQDRHDLTVLYLKKKNGKSPR